MSIKARRGNYLKSICLCKKIINKDKNNADAMKLLATNIIKLNRFDEVELALKKQLNLFQKNSHIRYCIY